MRLSLDQPGLQAAWPTLSAGDCLTLFTASGDAKHSQESLLLRWRWSHEGGFDPQVRRLIRGFEIEEAFETCIDIAEELLGQSPRGLSLDPREARFLEEHGYVISGGSLGLALLLGLLCYVKRVNWPSRCIAWGGLRPVRNNSFAVVTVAEFEDKMRQASVLKPRLIVHPMSESFWTPDGCRSVGISAPIEVAFVELAGLIDEGGQRVY